VASRGVILGSIGEDNIDLPACNEGNLHGNFILRVVDGDYRIEMGEKEIATAAAHGV
jgi:hypothetical protein